MATFHPFPRLPPELRHQIWDMTLVPRTVEMQPRSLFGRNPRVQSCPRYFEFFDKSNVAVASTPPPAILHACSESRAWAANKLYQRAFINDIRKSLEIGMPDTNSPWLDRTVVAMEWRYRKAMLKSPLYGSYVWIKFDIDTVSFRGLRLFPPKIPLSMTLIRQAMS